MKWKIGSNNLNVVCLKVLFLIKLFDRYSLKNYSFKIYYCSIFIDLIWTINSDYYSFYCGENSWKIKTI